MRDKSPLCKFRFTDIRLLIYYAAVLIGRIVSLDRSFVRLFVSPVRTGKYYLKTNKLRKIKIGVNVFQAQVWIRVDGLRNGRGICMTDASADFQLIRSKVRARVKVDAMKYRWTTTACYVDTGPTFLFVVWHQLEQQHNERGVDR